MEGDECKFEMAIADLWCCYQIQNYLWFGGDCPSHTSHDEKNDAFQLRCLTKNLGLAPTFIDRRNTNQAVLQKCTDIVFTNREDHKEISLFSEYFCRKTKLLGHVFRAPEDDPWRQVSFERNIANRMNYDKRGCGRPKQNWLHYAKKCICMEVIIRNLWNMISEYIMQP